MDGARLEATASVRFSSVPLRLLNCLPQPAHQLHVLDMSQAATARRGLTRVVVLHDLTAAGPVANQLALMQGGRLIGASPPAVVLTPPMLRDAYAVEVGILARPDGHPIFLPLRATTQCASVGL